MPPSADNAVPASPLLARLRSEPVYFLMALAFINYLGFAGWQTLFNNFAKEAASFSGAEIGLSQTVREIPGFLAFTAIFWFMVMREQTVAYVSLLVLGGGIAITGLYPTLTGLLITTFIMSVGFHYFETVNQSLAMQLFPKAQAPRLMGRVSGVTRSGLFVRLLETGADDFIPASTIGADYYRFVEEQQAMIGDRTGEMFRLGDTVEVKLVEAAPIAGALRFELLSEGARVNPSTVKRTGKRPSRSYGPRGRSAGGGKRRK